MPSPATYQLRIQLDDVTPPIWRTFTVPADIGLPELHLVLQVVMGWTDGHLHEFQHGKRSFGPPDLDSGAFGGKVFDEANFALNDLLKRKKQTLIYSYDFGDGWMHTVTLEEVLSEKCTAPMVIAGGRACPPEDCGGPYGYMEKLQALANPKAKGHKDLMEWWQEMTPDGHDPEVYSIAEVNEDLAKGIESLSQGMTGIGDVGPDNLYEPGDDKIIKFPGAWPKPL
jgi:hypothetical protein